MYNLDLRNTVDEKSDNKIILINDLFLYGTAGQMQSQSYFLLSKF